MEPKDIVLRSNAAWLVKDCWKSILQDAYEYSVPGLNPYAEDKKKPNIQGRLYDSTAVYSVIGLVNRYYNELTPPSGKLATLEVGPLLATQITEAQKTEMKKLLDAQNQIIEMILQTGSFVSAMWAAWLDYVVASMGCFLMLENSENDTEPFIFEAVSQADIALEEGVGGQISALSRRRFRFKIRKILELWPDAELPEKLKKKTKDDPEVNIIEYCHQENKIEKGGQIKVWIYTVLVLEGDAPIKILEREYFTCPYICFRGMRMAGSVYGISHVLNALPDIRTANVAKEMVLKNAAIALAGMYLAADDGVLNIDNIQITNGGIIPVERTGGSMGASLAPLETGRNFDIGSLILEDLQTQIKKGLKDNQLPPLAGKVRSPTEIIERQKEMTQDFGAEIPRLLLDLVVSIYRRAIDVGSRRGFLKPMKIDQFALKVTVKTPLARGSDAQEVEAFLQWWQFLVGILGPQLAMAVVKMEKVVPWLGTKIGISTDLYRPEEEIAVLKENIEKMVAAQSMQQAQPSIPAQA